MSSPSLAPRPAAPAIDGVELCGIEIAEFCGLKHEIQILELAIASTASRLFSLKSADGRMFPAQRSVQRPEIVFVQLALDPLESLQLTVESGDADLMGGFVPCCVERGDVAVITNGRFSLEVSLGIDPSRRSGFLTPGPISRVRIGEGAWRGGSFIDSRREVQSSHGEILEEGPLRVVYRYRVEFAGKGFYTALVTVDAGQIFARVEEEFSAGSGDQVVWDFSGADLPVEIYTLDSSAAYRARPLAYHYDLRLARLAAWTQQSQHLDFVDGFAVQFTEEDIAGFITLAGGSWRGDKLNHIEAWVRRWLPGDPASRRDVPADAKADSYPGPERVPARGGVLCEEHFQAEAWLGNGCRTFALVLTTLPVIQPPGMFAEEPLGHFEDVADRPRYARQQSILRKIHTQHGVLPLQEILDQDFSWSEEELVNAQDKGFRFPNEVLNSHFRSTDPTSESAAEDMLSYIEARVCGFWEGSGISYSNPVVSRRVAPEMFRYEWLVHEGRLSASERSLVRARFAFLMYLFASENYYTGDPAMLPAESPNTTEPTLAGMANQNFYTDVINIFGAGAQIFHRHPMAQIWRDRFIQQWHKQLAFHMYPESGLWEESHTYYQHVLITVLPTLLRRLADEVDDEFANPAMQRLVGSALKQLTPLDASRDGRRYLIAFGDHEPAPQPQLFGTLAEAFRHTNPTLTQQLCWMAQEMGSESQMTVAPVAPSWSNEAVQGLGIMFRGVDRQGMESLLALRSGSAWGHHHNDDGSIQFFAKGRPLIVDSAFGNSQGGGRKVEAKGHSRWSLRDLAPVNYYWRFNRGWVTDLDLRGSFPFAHSYSPVFMVRGGFSDKEVLTSPIFHWRTVVQFDAVTYLIIDSSRSSLPQEVRFHLAGKVVHLDGNTTVLRFPEGVLRIVPVLQETDLKATLNHPCIGQMAEEHQTTEIVYEIGVSSFAAFLLRVGEASEISSSANSCSLRIDEREIQLARISPDQVAITDLRSGEITNLNLIK
jgi:hypothetical protein